MARRRSGSVVGAQVGASASRAFHDPGTYAPRNIQVYRCAADDFITSVPFAVDVEVPTAWPCGRCGELASPPGSDPEELTHQFHGSAGKRLPAPPKSGIEYVRERRTSAQLEAALAEALSDLRTQTGTHDPHALDPKSRR